MRTETRLDFATFQLDETRTRCELWVTAGNETEKLASGLLKPFLTHLKAAQEQIPLGQTSIRLQPPINKRTLWFTKGTIERFVRFVTTPDVLERVSIVETERRQLEEAINILALGDQQSKQTTGALGFNGEDIISGDSAGDTSKNQLLVAMDARRIMLQKEQINAFSRAAAAGFDLACMADLIDFADCFGASRLREACLKFGAIYKKMQEKGQLSDLEVDISVDAGEDATERNKARRTWLTQEKAAVDVLHWTTVEVAQEQKEVTTPSEVPHTSPVKMSLDSPGEPDFSPSTEGNNSQQGTSTTRRLPRRVSSSPRRRSCSPMRRVQIARPGARRPSMVVVRNINYTSPGGADITKSSLSATADGSSDGSDSVVDGEDNKEERQQIRRLSVQDAINLFERKQKELQGQTAKEPRRASMDPGKSVLRRWSGVSSDSTTSTENVSSTQINALENVNSSHASVSTPKQQTINVHEVDQQKNVLPSPHVEQGSLSRLEEQKSWKNAHNDLEWKFQQLKLQEAALRSSSKDVLGRGSPVQPQQQKTVEQEINVHHVVPQTTLPQTAANIQFGFQYRGQKPSRDSVEKDLVPIVRQAEDGQSNQRSQEQGRFYEQYRERREAKIRQESDLKRAERESKLKAMQEILDKRKAELVAGRSVDKFTDRQLKPTSLTRKGTAQPGVRTSTTSRTSSTVLVPQTTPRGAKQLPPEPRSNVARKLSPGKPLSGPVSRGMTSSPKLTASPKLPRTSNIATQRRPANMSDNPLSRSMPSLSELRKENTRPSARTGQVPQPTRLTPSKNAKSGAGHNAARHKAVSKVLPLESNGVVPVEYGVQEKELKKPTAEDIHFLTPTKVTKDVHVEVSPRVPLPSVGVSHETKPFLRKGRGIGPGAGVGVMKLKAASEVEEDNIKLHEEAEEALLPAFPGNLPVLPTVPVLPSLPVVNGEAIAQDAKEEVQIPGSVRESQEMDIDSSSNENNNEYTAEVLVSEPVENDSIQDVATAHVAVMQDKATNTDASPTRLTLMQQLASEEYVESTSERRASLASVGSSSPCSSSASGVPQLRHSLSPDLNNVKAEKTQRRRWGSSQKPIPVVVSHQVQQKESPKGFKRLLKFGRKSRSNTSEWISASTTSEGEDTDDTNQSNGSSYLRRSTEAYSKESDHGPRSFFSLSSFRSKGGESKSRAGVKAGGFL